MTPTDDAARLGQLAVRKIMVVAEDIFMDGRTQLAAPVRRIAGIAVLRNPCAAPAPENLSLLSDAALVLGESLMARMMAQAQAPIVSYGKAAIVGTLGTVEHAAALLHPTLGRPMRAAVGGGAALIPSTAKVAAPGASIDVPLGHRDSPWSFDEIDTVTLGVPDAPLADEIVLVIAIACSGRPNARVASPQRSGTK